jgi:hypothetical protein
MKPLKPQDIADIFTMMKETYPHRYKLMLMTDGTIIIGRRQNKPRVK